MFKLLSISFAVLSLSSLASPHSASAQCEDWSYWWSAAGGNWFVPDNWEHEVWDPDLEACLLASGVPGSGDYAYIGTGTPYIGAPGAGCGWLDLDSQLNILAGGSLSCLGENVGRWGTGTIQQSGGTNDIAGDLYLGAGPGSAGTYELSETGQLSGHYEYVGSEGTGTFSQAGGSNNAWWLDIGSQEGAIGLYILQAGDLQTDGNVNVGFFGQGTFEQSGGTHSVDGTLIVGAFGGSLGTYHLSDGVLSSRRLDVGFEGTGTFTHSGGATTVQEDLLVGNVADGTFTQTGGTVRARARIY